MSLYYEAKVDSANQEFAKVYMAEDEDPRIFVSAPEYFPGLDYCAAMALATDVLLDTERQYSRQSFQNRARIRTPDGWSWLTIPIVGGQSTKSIREIAIDNSKNWRKKHLQSLRYNYRSTPFYDFIEPRIVDLFDNSSENLAQMLIGSTVLVHELFGFAGQVHQGDARVTRPRDKPLSSIGVDRLGSDSSDRIAKMNDFVYRQSFEDFVPDLTSLDLIFNYGPEAYTILKENIRTS